MTELEKWRRQLKKWRNEELLFLFWSFVSPGSSTRTHYGLEDVTALLSYDSKKRRGWKNVPLPQLKTDGGQRFLQKLLDTYESEHPHPAPPSFSTWHCSCGRENQHYVSTCVCGINKQDLQKRKYDRQ